MKKSSFQPAVHPVFQKDDSLPDSTVKETPQERVERLYAEDGGPLLGWLIDEAQLRGQLLSEMATDLHVTYGYINQLRNGCWRRFKIEPPCRLNFEPGLMADL